jgi:hypothetical protein
MKHSILILLSSSLLSCGINRYACEAVIPPEESLLLVKLDRSPDGRFGSECYLEFCMVTVAQLVITPERFRQKKVQVYGLLHAEFEASGVSDGAHRVWVRLTEKQQLEFSGSNRTYGYVRGVFDATKFGHLGGWGGTLTDISRFGK